MNHNAEAAAHGFALRGHEEYTNDVEFSPAALVDYLMTQSNVIVVVEEGKQGADDALAWLSVAVAELFPGPRGAFRFGGPIWYVQKRGARPDDGAT